MFSVSAHWQNCFRCCSVWLHMSSCKLLLIIILGCLVQLVDTLRNKRNDRETGGSRRRDERRSANENPRRRFKLRLTGVLANNRRAVSARWQITSNENMVWAVSSLQLYIVLTSQILSHNHVVTSYRSSGNRGNMTMNPELGIWCNMNIWSKSRCEGAEGTDPTTVWM